MNDDDQTGVERQERICRDVAERLGLIVAEDQVVVDNNRSAWQHKRKRPGWDALLAEASQGRIRHVVPYHPDRLMRQPRDLEELLQIADDHDITLHGPANRRDLADPDDRFFLRLEVAHACRSSDDTSRRLIDSMIDRAKEGRPHTGRRRYGYDKTGMVVVSEEATIVREIFTRYLDGVSPVQLAKELYQRGEKTAEGRNWSAPRARDVLDSRHVAGIRVFRGEEIGDGEWPAILDRGMWQEVRERRAYRMTHAVSAAAAPGRPRMADCYPYRIATRRGDLTLVWRPGEGDAPDELAVDDLGRLLAFHDLETLREYCDRNGWEIVWEGEGTLDLGVVRRWVEHPDLGAVPAGLLLDAWNFFEDLSCSLKAGPPLPSQGPIHDSAYEKIFGGEALEPTAGEGAWTDEETAAVRELLRMGLGLWEQAVHRSGTG